MNSEEGAFLTHANYLRALASVSGKAKLTSEDKALGSLVTRIGASPFGAETAPARSNHEQVRRSLANAWGTELMLALPARFAPEDEIMRLANNWAVVQAYYAVYHATQALAVAKGFVRPNSHPKTQNQYVDFWVKPALDLVPWSLAAASSGSWRNCPFGVAVAQLHPWTACTKDTALSLAAMAFRTTRDDTVAEAADRLRDRMRSDRRKEWLADERERLETGRKARSEPIWRRPRLSTAERSGVDLKVPPYGVIHYLYRLRIKTNYVDSAMFTDGPQDDAASRLVHADLRYLASSTLLLNELRIADLVGATRLRNWADEWISANGLAGSEPLGLQLRRQFL